MGRPSVYIVVRGGRRRRKARLVPRLGPVREQQAPPARGPAAAPFVRGRLMAQFSMTDTQEVDCSLTFVDKRGNPTNAPAGAGAPQWLVDNPAVLALTPSADGVTCTAAAVGPLGDATLSVKVTDSAGVALAAGSIDFTIVSSAPTGVNITPGTPSEQS
jgi:hypothetical protein